MAEAHHVRLPPLQPNHRGGRAARVAILYSGRWFGQGTSIGWATTMQWAQNHLEHVIKPNNASIYLVASSSNWCGPSSEAQQSQGSSSNDAILQRETRAAFRGWPDLHAALIPAQEDVAVDGAYADQAKRIMIAGGVTTKHSFVLTMIRNWRFALSHLVHFSILLLLLCIYTYATSHASLTVSRLSHLSPLQLAICALRACR